VAPDADYATLSLTRRAGTDLDQPDSGGTARPCHLTPLEFALPAVCDAFLCHPQFLPEAPPRSALRWPSHTLGVHGPQVLYVVEAAEQASC
jgi:hypothetical protein